MALLLALVPFETERAGADSEFSDSDDVTLSSLPSTGTATLHQLDPDDIPPGMVLSQVTVTASVVGEVDGSIQNLSSSQPKTLTTTVAADITVNGPEVSGLSAAGSDAFSVTLDSGDSSPVSIAGSDDQSTTVTGPDLDVVFVGEGSIDYDVVGQVKTTISGAANYKSTGHASGSATVSIEYEFASDMTTTTTTTTPTTTTTTTTTTIPEPECLADDRVELKFDDLDEMHPDTERTLPQDGVTITIFVSFDEDDEVDTLSWTSDHPIATVNIKTGSGDSDGGIEGDGMSGGPYDMDKAISHISFFFCPPT